MMQMQKRQGFTLIELMIVVMVIAIIAGVALPSYTASVKRTARNEARAVLYENQLFMEQLMAANSTYLVGGNTPVLPFQQSPKGGVAKYQITLVNPMANSYTLKATPVSNFKEPLCQTFVIDHTGRKTLEGSPTMSVEACWQGK
ncbi:type IV pilin protein [Massilia sp. W12]|uniref:type IV pilin protein n=1 Tax=Massilia sp. W12 TaxID=3126507 RepID=UPI0030D25DB1